MSAVDAVLREIIEREGGYVNNRLDRGGATTWGITEAVARANGYTGDMRYLPVEKAMDIYRSKYVTVPGFDKVLGYSPAIALELVDTYVNMGPGNKEAQDGPIFWLQRWLNAFNRRGSDYADINVDGAIGPATLGALVGFLRRRGKLGEQVMVAALNCSQGARYMRIIEGNPTQEEFAYGWLANRVLR